MLERKIEWFSGLGNNSIAIIQRRMIERDPVMQRNLELAVKVAFRRPVSDKTSHIEEILFYSCRKCLDEIGMFQISGVNVNNIDYETPALPLWGYLGMVGATLDCLQKSQIAEANTLLYTCGTLWGEIESKFLWERATDAAKALSNGGASHRLASDDERREIVCDLMEKRGKGARDAFRIAAVRFPEKGGESAFRSAYYKKPSNKSA